MGSSLLLLLHILTAFANGSRYGLSLVQLSTSKIEQRTGNASVAVSSAVQPVEAIRTTSGVYATAEIDGSSASCRDHTCSYGILLCEKLLRYGVKNGYETQIALYNGGGIRASIPAGAIEAAHLQNVHPHGDTISFFELKGAVIKGVLKKALTLHKGPGEGADGSWLQVAGLRFAATWDGSKWALDTVKVKHGQSWVDLDETATYKLVANSYLLSGKGGNKLIMNKATEVKADSKTIRDLMIDFFKHNSPVEPPAVDARETLMAQHQEPAVSTSLGEGLIWDDSAAHSGRDLSHVLVLVLALASGFIVP